jgi:hypothetical protein
MEDRLLNDPHVLNYARPPSASHRQPAIKIVIRVVAGILALPFVLLTVGSVIGAIDNNFCEIGFAILFAFATAFLGSIALRGRL